MKKPYASVRVFIADRSANSTKNLVEICERNSYERNNNKDRKLGKWKIGWSLNLEMDREQLS